MASREAQREFEEQYGQKAGNAEEIIKQNHARHPLELREASLKPLDIFATAALDLKKVAKEVEGTLKSASVRGRHIVAVVEDDAGRLWKEVLRAGDFVTQDDIDNVSDEQAERVSGPKQAVEVDPNEGQSKPRRHKKAATAPEAVEVEDEDAEKKADDPAEAQGKVAADKESKDSKDSKESKESK